MSRLTVQAIAAADAFALRRHYLRPMLPAEASRYEGDDHDDAIHLGAFCDLGTGEELVAVASFLPRSEDGSFKTDVYQLQGMVTRPEMRNSGIGTRLVEHGTAFVQERGATRLWCDGRTPATSFYQRLGFRVVGEEFETPATGPHYRFEKEL